VRGGGGGADTNTRAITLIALCPRGGEPLRRKFFAPLVLREECEGSPTPWPAPTECGGARGLRLYLCPAFTDMINLVLNEVT
jgi:hypothetical protein